MASTNSPQLKRKMEINNTPLEKVTSPVYYIKVNGDYVQVEKPNKYVPPFDDDYYVDPVVEEAYHLELAKSDCFDLSFHIPNGHCFSYDLTNEDLHELVGIYGRLGLHWYNLQKGSNLQLLQLVKYVKCDRAFGAYYITMEVMNPANNSHFTFQTSVLQYLPCKKADFKIVTQVCRIKPKPESSEVYIWDWNHRLMNDFNNGDLEWLPHDALTQSGQKWKQYYELQETEIEENEWLNLYVEFAFYFILGQFVPLKIKKVVVQTHENVETSNKLKSGNAIFYITFTDCTKDYATIVKRATDGIQGHLALEFKLRGVRA